MGKYSREATCAGYGRHIFDLYQQEHRRTEPLTLAKATQSADLILGSAREVMESREHLDY
jgi:hypothetical protein